VGVCRGSWIFFGVVVVVTYPFQKGNGTHKKYLLKISGFTHFQRHPHPQHPQVQVQVPGQGHGFGHLPQRGLPYFDISAQAGYIGNRQSPRNSGYFGGGDSASKFYKMQSYYPDDGANITLPGHYDLMDTSSANTYRADIKLLKKPRY
jgi:hypothetical protein